MTEVISAPHVYQAITNVMAIMSKEGIGKGRRNSQQGYNFRGIDDVYNTLCGVLADNRLVILPSVKDMQREERATQKGGMLNYTILTVDFKLVSSQDGSSDTIRMIGEAMDSADKSSNKSQSAALKYACLQVFMIPTEGDNDADATTHEVAAKPAREEPRRPAGKPDEKPATRMITPEQIDMIKGLMPNQKTLTPQGIIEALGLSDFNELTFKQASGTIRRLQEECRKAQPQRDEVLADEIPY